MALLTFFCSLSQVVLFSRLETVFDFPSEWMGGGGQGSHGELSIDLQICSYLQFYCPCQYFAVISLTTVVSSFCGGGGVGGCFCVFQNISSVGLV